MYVLNCVSIVGALNDPPDIPGLANLVGYLLMMGTKKYPGVYNFQKFVKNHGGTCYLPITKLGEQMFSFEIDPAHFTNALDRFASPVNILLLNYSI